VSNSYFQLKQFTIQQDRCAMKVTTDGCLFGAWAAEQVKSQIPIPIPIAIGTIGTIGTKVKNILDVGTGTGLLSLMLAQKNSSNIDAIEIDEDAYEQARENAAGSPFAGRVNLIHGDAKTFSFEKKYDVIVSNPPFYESEILSANPKKNVAHHHSGLLLDELLSVIKTNLASDGVFYLLLPYKRTGEIKKTLVEKDLSILKLVFVKQSTRHGYFRVMLAGSLRGKDEMETTIDELSISNEEQQYSDEVKELLKDYYLYL